MYSQYQSGVLKMDEGAVSGLLQHLSISELQELCDDDDKLTGLVLDLQQVKNLSGQKESQITSNKSVAEYNLSKEPQLTQAKTQLAQTYEQGIEIQKEFDKNKQQFDYLANQQSLDTVLALLQTEAAKSEEESEDLANKFLDGDEELDKFLDTYVQQRTTAHMRKVKCEKLADIMRGGTQPAEYRGANYGQQQAAPNSWGGAPYPAGPYSAMPAPGYPPR